MSQREGGLQDATTQYVPHKVTLFYQLHTFEKFLSLLFTCAFSVPCTWLIVSLPVLPRHQDPSRPAKFI